MKFKSQYKIFHLRKCIWKCRLRNGGHFVPGDMSYFTSRLPLCRPKQNDVVIFTSFANSISNVFLVLSLFFLKVVWLINYFLSSLRWHHNGGDSVSNHQPREGLLIRRLIRCRSKKTSKLRVAGLCMGNSPGTGEFPAQMASNAENVSIWWRHHDPYMFWLLSYPVAVIGFVST